ncbi:hypothetical protein AXK57_09390 [Tsukamurella pulmonis]|uniref:hypothetical protein n=1 Tax=Tsukamurella pulmonis TaxID=47312 RepID=UPI00079342FE|nr:hypothetical protein [Tsukamurella pulmonis]KXP10544.1 hypothetical protein AXK57_09390 [Tsukamurella pulmonis]RDH10776.1 hypothetical protein DVB88_15880 [Tsukamurella pulmonis]
MSRYTKVVSFAGALALCGSAAGVTGAAAEPTGCNVGNDLLVTAGQSQSAPAAADFFSTWPSTADPAVTSTVVDWRNTTTGQVGSQRAPGAPGFIAGQLSSSINDVPTGVGTVEFTVHVADTSLNRPYLECSGATVIH